MHKVSSAPFLLLFRVLRRALLVTPRAFCVTLQNPLNMQKAARFMQRAAFSFMRFYAISGFVLSIISTFASAR